MGEKIELGEITIDVAFKDIKNIHLSVHPPSGRVRLVAPRRISLHNLRIFALWKLEWIRRQQAKLREQERETQRDYVDRESHYLWGKRYLLAVRESDGPPTVELQHSQLVLSVRPGTGTEKRQAIVEAWYRERLKEAVPPLLARWQPVLGVEAQRWFVQRMKTRWGSCNHEAGTLRLNTELAKKPPGCLEYIVVHELVHLLEPTHNARFVALMDRFLPRWQLYRQELNGLPLRRETWSY